jgi:hypothetical protein
MKAACLYQLKYPLQFNGVLGKWKEYAKSYSIVRWIILSENLYEELIERQSAVQKDIFYSNFGSPHENPIGIRRRVNERSPPF